MNNKTFDPSKVKSHWIIMTIVYVLLLILVWGPIGIFVVFMSIPFDNSVQSQVTLHYMMIVLALSYPIFLIMSGALGIQFYRHQEYKKALNMSYVPLVCLIVGISFFVMLIFI